MPSTHDPAELNAAWDHLQMWLEQRFKRELGMEGILFIVGLHSRGLGYEPQLSKEEKQELIMEGSYCALEQVGLFERYVGDGGAVAWKRTSSVPRLDIDAQDDLLRKGILRYLRKQGLLPEGSPTGEPEISNDTHRPNP